jgi:hypothetical protein
MATYLIVSQEISVQLRMPSLFLGVVAQLAERLTCNQEVGDSISPNTYYRIHSVVWYHGAL